MSVTKEQKSKHFKTYFNISISIESIDFEICEDDGYGNSHYKGQLTLNNYTTLKFNIQRKERNITKSSVVILLENSTIGDIELKYYEHDVSQDKRGYAIQEQANIFKTYMMYVLETGNQPFMRNEVPEKKTFWQYIFGKK